MTREFHSVRAGAGAGRSGGAWLLGAVRAVLSERRFLLPVALVLLVWEVVFNAAIISRVPYTEIDWQAYMEEVEGPFEHGVWDYYKLGGATGHLPYPAGFVYVFAGLRALTGGGKDILRAQAIFAALHVALLAVVFAIYTRLPRASPGVLILLCLSHRVHSIFALRLFNDGVAMLVLYVAVLLFALDMWTLGCVVFSAAVSIKMSALLFAPGLLVLLLKRYGLARTIPRLALCAVIQLGLAVPFLAANAEAYVARSFNLGRVFEHRWTVNLAFLPEPAFVAKETALVLLAAHVLVLVGFARSRWWYWDQSLSALLAASGSALRAEHVVLTLFASNFIGIVFARTLHYQFYVWYFHCLPALLWSTDLPVTARLAVLASIEYAFNVFPATATSSLVLTVAHMLLLAALAVAPLEDPRPIGDLVALCPEPVFRKRAKQS